MTHLVGICLKFTSLILSNYRWIKYKNFNRSQIEIFRMNFFKCNAVVIRMFLKPHTVGKIKMKILIICVFVTYIQKKLQRKCQIHRNFYSDFKKLIFFNNKNKNALYVVAKAVIKNSFGHICNKLFRSRIIRKGDQKLDHWKHWKKTRYVLVNYEANKVNISYCRFRQN